MDINISNVNAARLKAHSNFRCLTLLYHTSYYSKLHIIVINGIACPLARSKPRTDQHSADLLVSVSEEYHSLSLSLCVCVSLGRGGRDETDAMKTAEKLYGKRTRDRPRSGRHGLGARDINRHHRLIRRILCIILLLYSIAPEREIIIIIIITIVAL